MTSTLFTQDTKHRECIDSLTGQPKVLAHLLSQTYEPISHGRLICMKDDAIDFPMPEIDANGVDRSQIRNHLKLTPLERLKLIEVFLASTLRIRRGLRRTSISSNPVPPR